MPFDDHFRSKPKHTPKLNRYGKPAQPESIEMQLGRSDHRLGALQSQNPFPADGTDAKEWTRGWLAERSIEISNQQAGALAAKGKFRCPL